MNYDIAEALRKMEEELIQSMKRNLQRHLKEEDAEGFDWAQWQAEKLNSIARYRAQNRHIIGGYISTIPQQIEDMIRQSYETGKQQEEIRILKAIRQGYIAAAGTAGEIGTGFFTVNERKLNALVKATQGEMHKAVSSILRYQDDIYRQTVFRSAAQFNMGGKSLGQAVDAAAQDFLAQGIRNIRYKDGRYVNIASYAEMALRTANLRANIQGEAAKRDEWGICTVKLSAHGSACPKCIPWQGKVYYDDVYGSVPVPKDGKYPLLSTAIAGGALHPNCKNGVHTWFEGINQPPREMTQEEIDEANRRYDLEQQQRYCERNVRKYKRLKLGAIDPENAAKYAAQEQAWRKRLNGLVKENPDVLRIDYRRLRVYDAPASPAGKSAAVPPTPKAKVAKAKAHTEGISAGHAVEVTPPAAKDNGGTGKMYSPEEVKHLKGNYSIAFDKVSGTKEITPQLAREFSDEYDRFTQKFGEMSSVSSVSVEPYKSNRIWGTYNDNNGTISISGAGGKDGKNTISKVAAEMKKTGKWSSSSPYHAFRHELGHALQKHLKDTVPDYEERLKKVRDIRDAFFESLTGLDEDDIMKLKKEALSIYGLVDDESLDEFIAECVAEYCSKKPRKMSRDVVAALLHKGGNENAD